MPLVSSHHSLSVTSTREDAMSAATAQPCVVCQATSSKYKCPTCRSATCSLACSKQHAAQGHALGTQQSNATSSSPSVAKDDNAMLPSLHIRSETIEAPRAHRFSKVDKYVGLNEYDSKQLLEDFEYLQYMGKCVTSLGKDITRKGWIKEEAPKQKSSQHPAVPERGTFNKTTNGFHRHVSGEAKSRQSFESWLRKLRLPIMLVPDGMSLRKENQTRWKNNTKQLLCTVEIHLPTIGSSSRTRSVVHHVPWDKQVVEVVVKEMERRGKQKSKDLQDDIAALVGKVTSGNWSDSLCIALRVSNERLRNESSSKFLEWWQRQVKNGMVKADGLEFDEVKKGELEQLRNGAWAAIEGIESAEACPADDQNAEQGQVQGEDEKKSGGLISSMLLDKMQAARAIKAQCSAEMPGGSNLEKNDVAVSGARRSLIVLRGEETLQEMLQSLPKGLAVVEYFHFEVWPKEALSEHIKSGSVVREKLEGRGDDEVDLERRPEKRPSDQRESIDTPQAKRAKTAVISSNALGSLTAYASSSEDEDEDDDEAEDNETGHHSDDLDDTGPVYTGGLAEMARSLGMVPS